MQNSISKRQLILLVVLIVSVGLNAWQYGQRVKTGQETVELSPGESVLNGAARTRSKSSSQPVAKTDASALGQSSHAHGDLASVMAIKDPLDRMQAMIDYIRDLPTSEIGDLIERMGSAKDPKTQFLTHLLLNRWGQEDPDAAFASLGNLSAERNGSQANAVLAGLAASNPQRAVAWLTDPENNAQHQPWMGHSLAQTLAEEWSRQDPQAALAWAASLEPGELQTGAYAGVIGSILDTDPQRAASLAMELQSDDRSKLLGRVATTWAEQAPESAIEWVETLQGADRQATMSEALASWAHAAPQSAASYVSSLPETERGEHVGSVARAWAEQAPAEAAHWLGAQPNGQSKAEAMGHVMWNWTSQDPEAASTWLSEQPPGESFDRGVAGLAKAATHAFDDPEAGVTWAATIQNEELRADMTRHTLGQWMEQNPSAAQAWATENGVDVAPSTLGK
jgi:hypothetical protein